MYTFYTKEKDKVLVQNSNMNNEIFDNTNNIEHILKTSNNIEYIEKQKEKFKLIKSDELQEEISIKIIYLDLMLKLERKKLDKLLNRSIKVYTKKKVNKYISNSNYIDDLTNKLKLIDFYLEIRDSITNHKELKIVFNDKENQSKKLKFINLCLININNPENFINSLVKKDNTYSIKNKQKKLI